MKETPEIAAMRIEAERRRARLMGTAHEIQDRLTPRALTRNAWEGAKSKGADLAEEAVDAVRARPFAAGGVVAALALFLAREPLWDLATRLAGKGSAGKRRSRKKKQEVTEAAE